MTARFRLSHPIVPEDELHASVAQALHRLLLPPVEWTCFPSGNIPLPAQYAAKLARFGLKRGWPDIQLLYDRGFYGIELKRVGGGLSKTRVVRTRSGAQRVVEGQADVFPRLEAQGMQIAVCHSVPEVLAACQGWGLPMVPCRVAA